MLSYMDNQRRHMRNCFLLMVFGYAMFALGTFTLGLMTPEDPRWLVMLLVCFTWANVFVAQMGFIFLLRPLVVRKVARHFELPNDGR